MKGRMKPRALLREEKTGLDAPQCSGECCARALGSATRRGAEQDGSVLASCRVPVPEIAVQSACAAAEQAEEDYLAAAVALEEAERRRREEAARWPALWGASGSDHPPHDPG